MRADAFSWGIFEAVQRALEDKVENITVVALVNHQLVLLKPGLLHSVNDDFQI